MRSFTFIHAADLHLDAALPYPGKDSTGDAAFAALLTGAVYTALNRLADLCIERGAAFLLLAGDVFHTGNGSLKANFALRDVCKRLAEHGVEVFWARGNHDPASTLPQSMDWPANLHIFSTGGEVFTAQAKGHALALVQGASHASAKEQNNLAKMLHGQSPKGQDSAPDALKIGVLHCAVRGKSGRHDNYAPCGLEDLQDNAYWAVGHVHERSILRPEAPVVYPGSLQGLHINETGAHGCYVAQVNARGKVDLTFAPLAPVRWEKLRVDLPLSAEDEAEAPLLLGGLEEEIITRMREAAAQIGKESGAPVQAVIFRVELGGRSSLDEMLRTNGSLAEFTERLSEALLRQPVPAGEPQIRIKDIVLDTMPDVDVEALLKSDNLVGETLRRVEAFRAAQGEEGAAPSGQDFASFLERLPREVAEELRPFYADKRAQAYLRAPDAAQLEEWSREAAGLCLNLFEVK